MSADSNNKCTAISRHSILARYNSGILDNFEDLVESYCASLVIANDEKTLLRHAPFEKNHHTRTSARG